MCCPGARAQHGLISLIWAINPPPGREGCTQCCQSQGGCWAQGIAGPCHDGPTIPWDSGMTQRGRPGAGRAISAAAEGCEGRSHGRTSPGWLHGALTPLGGRRCKTSGTAQAGPIGCLQTVGLAAGRGTERAAQTLPQPGQPTGSVRLRADGQGKAGDTWESRHCWKLITGTGSAPRCLMPVQGDDLA